jgi:hypothetical protein
MLSTLRNVLIGLPIFLGLCVEGAQAQSVGDDVVGIICDPVKLRAGSANILEAVERLNALVSRLSETERQTNADLKARIAQVQNIVNDVIADVDKNVAQIDSLVKGLEAQVDALEKRIYADVSAVMFQLTCVVEQAGSDQVQRAVAETIGNVKRADPHINILGLREKLWVKVAQVLIKVPEACKSKP